LAAPTPASEIKSRTAYGKNGPVYNPDGTPKMLDYVDARFVQERLDEVVGQGNWQTQFQDTPGGIRCGIGILIEGDPIAQWVWKWDVGIPSNIEPVKGAHSDAFKRAAVQWGIGRDLYQDRAEDEPDPSEVQPTVTQQMQGHAQPTTRTARYTPPTQTAQTAQTNGPININGVDYQPKTPLDPGQIGWGCPIHGEVEIVPGGVSRKTNRPYNAFLACPERGCDEKGPRVSDL
jgi:hypothetical protein